MSFRGTSAKKFAQDISKGFVSVTAANLRKYSAQDLKTLLNSMKIVLREVQQIVPEENDYDVIKKKNWKMQNLKRSTLIINTFMKSRRMH